MQSALPSKKSFSAARLTEKTPAREPAHKLPISSSNNCEMVSLGSPAAVVQRRNCPSRQRSNPPPSVPTHTEPSGSASNDQKRNLGKDVGSLKTVNRPD